VAIALHRTGRSTVAQTAEKAVQFFIENGLNRAADVGAKAILDRIKTFLTCKSRRRAGVCNLGHGVISCGGASRRLGGRRSPGDYAAFRFPPTSRHDLDADLEVKKDPISLAAFTAAIRARFETPNVHVDIFDRHRVILDGEECELVQVAVYREGRPEDMLGLAANSTLSRRIVKPVFEAALTYEAATGVIEVVAKSREDRIDLTRFMARDLLGITLGEDQSLPLREYDLSMLLRPFDFPTDPADGIASVTVKELRLMDLGDAKERITLESMSGADRTIWQMAEHRFGLDIGGGAHVFGHAGDVPEWVVMPRSRRPPPVPASPLPPPAMPVGRAGPGKGDRPCACAPARKLRRAQCGCARLPRQHAGRGTHGCWQNHHAVGGHRRDDL
jgi:hypothetical protein